MKKNVIVICGGKSIEHEISLKSATAIINAIDREKFNVYPVYISHGGVWASHPISKEKIEKPEDLIIETGDNVAKSLGEFLVKLGSIEDPVIFPALHGPHGEDGTVQGLFELLNLPYVGCGVLSSSVAMDKLVARDLFEEHNIPQCQYLGFMKDQWVNSKDEIVEKILELGLPVYIKPSNCGSSVGISRVDDSSKLKEAIEAALVYDLKIIVEREIKGREMQVSVIGNARPKASLPGEFEIEDPFFDYDTKYLTGTAVPVVPARLTEETTEKVRKVAIDAYKVLNCTGLSRVDIFVDEENQLFVNEINTLPGFTPVSMTPVLWKATENISYPELVEILIDYGLELFKEKQAIQHKR